MRWPRPGPPVIKLQHKWALEYGFPSTHAMVGVSIPFSILLYTMNRYEYNIGMGFAAAVVWCTVVCLSRLYLGMHSVLVGRNKQLRCTIKKILLILGCCGWFGVSFNTSHSSSAFN